MSFQKLHAEVSAKQSVRVEPAQFFAFTYVPSYFFTYNDPC